MSALALGREQPAVKRDVGIFPADGPLGEHGPELSHIPARPVGLGRDWAGTWIGLRAMYLQQSLCRERKWLYLEMNAKELQSFIKCFQKPQFLTA